VLTCHCTVGVGVPVAAAVKVAVAPAVTVRFVGLVVIVGAVFPAFTVKVAFVVVALPAAFVKTARYLLPFCVEADVKLKVVAVAPDMLVNDVPPFVLTCH
jgi:hypothetical protein